MRPFVTILFLHVIPALLALRKILMQDAEGRAWQVAWSLIATCVPFFGPVLFFGLAQMPGLKNPSGRGGSGAEGIPAVANLLTGATDQHETTNETMAAEIRAQAEAGDAKAQTRLGTLYEYGDCIKQDYAAAMVWYGKAAAQGFAPAQGFLGNMYERGAGVAQSDEEACFWFTLAAMNDAKFIVRRDKSAASLTPEQIDSLRRRVRTWTPADPALEGKGVGVS